MKILLAVDGSDYTKRMISYIAAHDELLGPTHAYLLCTVASVLPSHVTRFLDQASIDACYREQANDVLRPLKRFVDQQGWQVETRHEIGQPAEVIAALADREKVGLIVMGSHGQSAIGNLLLGSVATGVLARSKCPVLLIR